MFHRISLIFLLLSSADGFIINKTTRNSQVFLHESASPRDDGFSSGRGDNDSVEAARQRFEAMMVGVGDTASVPSTVNAEVTAGSKSSSVAERPVLDVSAFPSLTSIARERRVAEIHFLSSLNDADEGAANLWNLWGSERGPTAAKLLKEADECTERHQWDRAEALLRQLVDTHGMFWVEPVSQLALLLYKRSQLEDAAYKGSLLEDDDYKRGQLEEAKDLCLKVLEVKPWHFRALSGIVWIYESLNEVSEARYWAARRLPPLQPTGPNRRRQQWVLQATKEARSMLTKLEEHTRDSYGPSEHPGDRPPQPPRRSHLLDDEEDSW
eukprot:CAMPEP_0194044988 /NCGR_PEP_ID=MMETSP0009_2-20130614/16377_1 /TAXON_ID=210454 /ORGANISM="Grammatophora oceanica, Strain CCMP 410" /LENGTH=324 /DNA_ID=CAMNT_0038689701 /DNA_START=62 /DNA_END=1033 /DNA_ORIENTATION=-